jgi:dCTP diphosphatase
MSKPGNDPFTSLLAELRRFVDEREWAQFHDPKNLAMCLASEAGELLAEYRWVRNEDSDAISHEVERRARIAAEVGDVGIALLLLCDRIGLDFLGSVSEKLIMNARRYPVESSRGHAEPPPRRGS